MPLTPSSPFLLFLPSAPHPRQLEAFQSSYIPPLAAALARIRSEEHERLVVAVPGNFIRDSRVHWSAVQDVLAKLYTVIAIVSSGQKLPVEGSGAIDICIRLVHFPSADDLGGVPDITPAGTDISSAVDLHGCTISTMESFAHTSPLWKRLFHAGSDVGRRVANYYLEIYENHYELPPHQVISLPGGVVLPSSRAHSALDAPSSQEWQIGRNVVCLGGTFDHVHPGHKLLLSSAATLLKVPSDTSDAPATLIVGVTSGALLVNKKYAEFMQPWDERAESVISFFTLLLPRTKVNGAVLEPPTLHKKDGEYTARFCDGRVEVRCVEIADPFGPTVTIENIDLLVVSRESYRGGLAINEERAKKGWPALELFEVDVLSETLSGEQDGNFADKLSSTAIRKLLSER